MVCGFLKLLATVIHHETLNTVLLAGGLVVKSKAWTVRALPLSFKPDRSRLALDQWGPDWIPGA